MSNTCTSLKHRISSHCLHVKSDPTRQPVSVKSKALVKRQCPFKAHSRKLAPFQTIELKAASTDLPSCSSAKKGQAATQHLHKTASCWLPFACWCSGGFPIALYKSKGLKQSKAPIEALPAMRDARIGTGVLKASADDVYLPANLAVDTTNIHGWLRGASEKKRRQRQ